MTYFWLFATIVLSVFTQSFSGFGFALVSMPLVTPMTGLQISAPLIALLGMTAEVVLLIYFREALTLKEMGILVLASFLGTLVGVSALRWLPERLLLSFLGGVLVLYALYNLLKFRLPVLRGSLWAWLLGGLAGALGGAYNTSGPPVIIYGHARGWEPAQFKGNLQGFFFINNIFVLTGHALSGNLTPVVWRTWLFLLPALGPGLALGLWAGKRLDAQRFRQVVQVLLLLMGVRLLAG